MRGFDGTLDSGLSASSFDSSRTMIRTGVDVRGFDGAIDSGLEPVLDNRALTGVEGPFDVRQESPGEAMS